MVTVSVIIPLYNKGKYIARALDSVFSQTYQDFEVIVVDDGSTDNGPEIVKQYNDPRLRLIHQDNAGPGAARNHGIKESKGKFLTFLDADDEWLPEYLMTNVSIVTNYPQVEVVASSWFADVIPSGIRNVNMADIHRSRGIQDGLWRLQPGATAKDLKYMMEIFWSGTVFCRRETLERYGGFYFKNKCTHGEDYYLHLQFAFNCVIYRNVQPLAYYHNDNSELASGGYRTRILEAFMLDPDPIRLNCSAQNREALERWFALYALQNAHNRISVGKASDAQYLAQTFPLMKTWRWEYAKLRIKMACPRLIPYVQAVKKLVHKSTHNYAESKRHNSNL